MSREKLFGGFEHTNCKLVNIIRKAFFIAPSQIFSLSFS
jgi:hypothetical protein